MTPDPTPQSAPVRIAVMEGDGIGPEITAATITALVVAASILAIAWIVAARPQVTGASLLSMVGGVAGTAQLFARRAV